MKKANKYLRWLVSHATELKIYSIEQQLNMPEGTLKKFADEKRDLPDKWHPVVIGWVTDFLKVK